jgi:NTP pyrophosphatase (non-canonical NTP hydrolase)
MQTFSEYQNAALETAQYPHFGLNMVYPALGLVGEAGEAADKIKKFYRNSGGKTAAMELSYEQRLGLAKEIGDVLWYIAALAYEINISMDAMARMNIDKLRDRAARNAIMSEGDNR